MWLGLSLELGIELCPSLVLSLPLFCDPSSFSSQVSLFHIIVRHRQQGWKFRCHGSSRIESLESCYCCLSGHLTLGWRKTCRGQDRFWKLERLSFIRLLCEKRVLEFRHLFTTGYCMLSLDWSPVSSTYTIRKKYFALHVSATSFRHASWDSSVWIKSKIAVVTVSTRFQHATEILKR